MNEKKHNKNNEMIMQFHTILCNSYEKKTMKANNNKEK